MLSVRVKERKCWKTLPQAGLVWNFSFKEKKKKEEEENLSRGAEKWFWFFLAPRPFAFFVSSYFILKGGQHSEDSISAELINCVWYWRLFMYSCPSGACDSILNVWPTYFHSHLLLPCWEKYPPGGNWRHSCTWKRANNKGPLNFDGCLLKWSTLEQRHGYYPGKPLFPSKKIKRGEVGKGRDRGTSRWW